jgi:hypothetical protein
MGENPHLPSGQALEAYQPHQTDAENHAKGRILATVIALICSNLFSLFVGGIYEYLSLRGVVNVDAARYVLFFCWVIGSAGIVICVLMLVDGAKKKFWFSAPYVVALAIFLSLLDLFVSRLEPNHAVVQPTGATQIAAELFKLVPGLSPSQPAAETSNRATKGGTSEGSEKAEVPKSTSLGVHKPTETLVIPPNSSAVISPGSVSSKDMSELDRMEQEAVQAGAHLSTDPDKLVLHDLFLTDFSSEDNNSVSLRSGFVIQNNETKVITHIEYRIVRQLTRGTKVLLLYILPTAETPHLCVSLADHYDVALGDFMEGRTEAIKLPGDSEQMTTQDTVLSKRIFIYHETYVSPQQAIDSSEAFKKKGISVILRSSDYLENRRLQAKVKLLEKRRKAS